MEKEQNIIKALKDSNFDLFDGDQDEAYDTLERTFTAFPDYASTVIRMNVIGPIWRNRLEGQELRDRITEIDRTRHIKHENAIASVSILNRMSRMLGLEPFADIDVTDRYAVADFVGSYVSQVYEDGTKTSMDAVVLDKQEEYDPHKIHDRIAEIDARLNVTGAQDEGPEGPSL